MTSRVLLLWLVAVSVSRGEKIDLYIIAGQSNAVGYGNSLDYPGYLSPQPNVLYHPNAITTATFQSNAWTDLQDLRAFLPRFGGASFGPELSFGHALSQSSQRRIGIIKAAANSTALATHWLPSTGGNLYDWMKERVATAIEQLPSGLEATIAGFFWIQGEADSGDLHWANAYQANLQSLVDAVRRDFGNPELPFLLPLLHADVPTQGRKIVRAAQTAVASAGRNVILFNNDDQSLIADRYHYTPQMHLALGYRFAGAFDFGANFLRRQREANRSASSVAPEPNALVLGVLAALGMRRRARSK